MERTTFVWLPIVAVLVVGLMLGGLGSLFTWTRGAAESAAPVIGLGLGIIVFVPLAALFFLRRKGPGH